MLGLLILIIFSVILIPKIGYTKSFEDSAISLQTSQNIKGVLCIAIFFNHFTGWFPNQDPVMYMFVHCGTLVVSVFFFLSAYGLRKRYAASPMSFVELIKRLLFLMIPYWICEAVYCAVSTAFDIPIKVAVNPKNIIISAFALVDRSEIVENAWFVTAILAMYIIFFIAYKYSPLKNKTLFFAVLFIIVTVISKGKWVTSSVAFLLGVIIADYESEIYRLLKNKYMLLFLSVGALTVVGFAMKFVGQYLNKSIIMDLSDTVTSVLFSLFVYILVCRVKIGNVITKFLSKISYEVYLIHGLMIRISYRMWGLENRIMFCLTALALTIAASLIINFITAQIKKAFNKPKKAQTAD